MLLGSLASIVLVGTTIWIHFEFLSRAQRMAERSRLRPRLRVVALLAGAFVAHTVEVYVYAVGYMVLATVDAASGVTGVSAGSFDDYVYFSAVCYSTLGFGDMVPLGATRLIAGTEALNGLVLITWTASVTYLMMDRYWRNNG